MYGISGLGRFRVSAFRQRGWVGLVLRRILPGIPGFEALALPASLVALVDRQCGLVLVAGLAGSGKTATLAAMVDHVNTTRAAHIVTIEDPIEVLHADKRSLVDQREVGSDTRGYADALSQALRQDPDVVMVGRLPDPGAIASALQAAETGHLVLASVAATSAIEAIERVVQAFPPHQQQPVRATLAGMLQGVVSQQLLPRARGRGRVPAVEVLVTNARVAERIADDRLAELEREMEDGDLYGMQTLDQSLAQLYADGLVSRADALTHAKRRTALQLVLDRHDLERGQVSSTQPRLPSSARAS